MCATRRRHRTLDPLASPDAVRRVCHCLRERFPELIPQSEKELRRFLVAVRHAERRPVTDAKRGRPSRFGREDLLKAASALRFVLGRETGGRISVSSFVGQYVPVLDFPSDVTDALSSGQINLQEAAQLSRLTAERWGLSAREARTRRRELLRSHVAVRGSQPRLRARVREILGEAPSVEITAGQMEAVVARVDEMLEIDPSDTRHLFWEEMKHLFFAMRDTEPEDLDDEMMGEFLSAMDGISNVLYRIEKRRQERHKQQGPYSV